MASVRLNGVTKIFPPDVRAIDNISLDVPDKQFLVLVGPSGCGKSTTLRAIAGLEEVTKGEIYIDDKMVNDVPPKNRNIAMVFQNYALYPHMTVYKNMAFGLKLRRMPKAEIDQRVKETADILGIRHLLDRKPKALSGGERQRVAVGRAIVRKPKVFLFDEPLSNLDAKLRVQMRAELSKLHQRLQTTMIYVTHDQVEAMTMGDRIVVLKDGIVQQIDNPINLYDHPATVFVAGFIGSPPMNFFNGAIESENGSLFFNEGKFKVQVSREHKEKVAPYAGRKILFGIRPEDISPKGTVGGPTAGRQVTSTIEVVEPMGSEVYLYLNTGINSYIARVKSHPKSGIRQSIDMVFDMDKAHFFDPETEKAVV
jgi:multiple sugar transport system ATP-binding protein